MKKQVMQMAVVAVLVMVFVGVASGAESSGLPPTVMEINELDKLAGEPVPGKEDLRWKRMDVLIEWGFKDGTENTDFSGRVEASHQGMLGKVEPLASDPVTNPTGSFQWESPGAGESRRGIVLPLLYVDTPLGPEQTAITVWTKSGSFTFLPADTETGPILTPEYGFFVAHTNSNTTARDFIKELAAKNLKTIRQRVREHPEQTWEQAVRALHGDQPLPPYPTPPYDPAMKVEVPCERLTAAWHVGAWHLIRRCPRVKTAEEIAKVIGCHVGLWPKELPDNPEGRYVVGCYPFEPLALETDQIILALDMMGMHHVARQGLSWWLERQQPDGRLSLGTWMDDLHGPGPGNMLWVLAEHYALTGDKEWLAEAAPKMKACVNWIAQERRKSAGDTWPANLKRPPSGLMPPVPVGDLDHGHNCYYFTDGICYMGVRRCAEILGDVDPKMAAEVSAEAQAYRMDLLAASNKSIALSPVIQVLDGTYHSFIPLAHDVRGSCVRTGGTRSFGHGGPYWGDTAGMPRIVERTGLWAPNDPRISGYLDVLEDVFLLDNPKLRRRTQAYNPTEHWFSHAGWHYQCGHERMANLHLHQDDVPNFLRSWLNAYAVDIMPGEYTFREHTTGGPPDKSFEEAAFLERFRLMLIMEKGENLWLAQATPRAWLEQGKRIAIKNAPTYFGTLAYEIISDVDNGKITATIEMPSRKPPKSVIVRFRHPKATPIKSVMVNGRPWTGFDKDKEVIKLIGLKGKVVVAASY